MFEHRKRIYPDSNSLSEIKYSGMKSRKRCRRIVEMEHPITRMAMMVPVVICTLSAIAKKSWLVFTKYLKFTKLLSITEIGDCFSSSEAVPRRRWREIYTHQSLVPFPMLFFFFDWRNSYIPVAKRREMRNRLNLSFLTPANSPAHPSSLPAAFY